jgi:hypothetical protein
MNYLVMVLVRDVDAAMAQRDRAAGDPSDGFEARREQNDPRPIAVAFARSPGADRKRAAGRKLLFDGSELLP